MTGVTHLPDGETRVLVSTDGRQRPGTLIYTIVADESPWAPSWLGVRLDGERRVDEWQPDMVKRV